MKTRAVALPAELTAKERRAVQKAVRQRAGPSVPHYVFHPDQPDWTGPVERRDPAAYRRTSVQLTWRCQNPFCCSWTMNGAYKTGRCNFCQTPRISS